MKITAPKITAHLDKFTLLQLKYTRYAGANAGTLYNRIDAIGIRRLGETVLAPYALGCGNKIRHTVNNMDGGLK